MAVDYAVYLHNHMPRPSVGMLAPIDLLLKTQSARTHFHDMHVWGCPCYILDPQLQDGHKLPKWKPRSCRGMFVGFSPGHSSLVPLVLNPRTGKISPQFQVVFDNWFTSVLSVGADDAFEPSMWQTLFSHSRYHYMLDDHDAISLSDHGLIPDSKMSLPTTSTSSTDSLTAPVCRSRGRRTMLAAPNWSTTPHSLQIHYHHWTPP